MNVKTICRDVLLGIISYLIGNVIGVTGVYTVSKIKGMRKNRGA